MKKYQFFSFFIKHSLIADTQEKLTTMVTMGYTKFTMNLFFVTMVLSLCTLWLNYMYV